jgi:hypothetical protein
LPGARAFDFDTTRKHKLKFPKKRAADLAALFRCSLASLFVVFRLSAPEFKFTGDCAHELLRSFSPTSKPRLIFQKRES